LEISSKSARNQLEISSKSARNPSSGVPANLQGSGSGANFKAYGLTD
jgi:hypothetical protein